MANETEWNKFIARTENFYWDSETIKQQFHRDRLFYEPIYDLSNSLISERNQHDKNSQKKTLDVIFNKVYDSVIRSNPWLITYFSKESFLHDNVYNACFHTTLCMFLRETKRIKGKSLKRFIYDNSTDNYNDPNSKYFCKYEAPTHGLLDAETTFRQQRYRILSSRPTYNKRPEWNGMSKDSEDEWSFIFILEHDNSLYDTFKRIGNLYNDINQALSAPQNDKDSESIQLAHKKFLSKLKKIKYDNYLKLQQTIFEHICKNNDFYGINLYRAEKRLRIYITTNEVNRLISCKTEKDKKSILEKSVLLNNICFPKVYSDFSNLPDYKDIYNCASLFQELSSFIIPVMFLIIDELIENNYLGEDWCNSIKEITNEMAKEVLWDPKDIDFTIHPKSQECFMEILLYAEKRIIFDKTGIVIP